MNLINHMKGKFYALALLAVLTGLSARAQRKTESFNDGWEFRLGKAGTEMLKDRSKDWSRVALPYDWVPDLAYAFDTGPEASFRKFGQNYPENSEGWFRKSFTAPVAAYVALCFDGVRDEGMVYLNGYCLGATAGPAASAVFELTPYLKPGEENVLAVHVKAAPSPDGIYTGAGILRDVRLVTAAGAHIPVDGMAARAFPAGADMRVEAACALENTGSASASVSVIFSVLDARGVAVATASPQVAVLQPQQRQRLENTLSVPSAAWWSPDVPNLYTLTATVYNGSTEIDSYALKVGLCEARYDGVQGLVVNGVPTPMRGVDVYQYHAGVGGAVPDSLWRQKLTTLKRSGCNLIRTYHFPASGPMLDLCDELGLLVIDEMSGLGLGSPQREEFESLLARDGHHASLAFWSVGAGLEEVDFTQKEVAARVAAMMAARDGSRSALFAEGELALPKAFSYRGSEEGLLNAIGGPQEPFYAREVEWKTEPVLEVAQHWNHKGRENLSVPIRIYTNCDEVRFFVNGSNKGTKKLLTPGYVEWSVPYKSGRIEARGFLKGKQVVRKLIETSELSYQVHVTPSKTSLKADGEDVVVLEVEMVDYKGRLVPDVRMNLTVYVDEDLLSAYGMRVSKENDVKFAPIRIVGYGNGDPQFNLSERPEPLKGDGVKQELQIYTYNGKAQVILRSVKGASGAAHVRVGGTRLHGASFDLQYLP